MQKRVIKSANTDKVSTKKIMRANLFQLLYVGESFGCLNAEKKAIEAAPAETKNSKEKK